MFQMKGLAAMLVATISMGPFHETSAQTPAIEDNCADLLQMAGRDFDTRTYDTAIRRYVVNSYCENGQPRRNTQLIDETTVQLLNTLDAGEVHDDLAALCRNYQSSDDAWLQNHTAGLQMVDAAIGNWQSCKAVAAHGVSIIPHVENRAARFDIDLRRTATRSVDIRGIFYDPQRLKCTDELTDQVIDQKTTKLLNTTGWSIHCERVASAGAARAPIAYQNAKLRIQTTRGPFDFWVPPSAGERLSMLLDVSEKATGLRNQAILLAEGDAGSALIPDLNARPEISIARDDLKLRPWPGVSPDDDSCRTPEQAGRIVIHSFFLAGSRIYVCSRNPGGWQVVEAADAYRQARDPYDPDYRNPQDPWEERCDPNDPYWDDMGLCHRRGGGA